MSVARLEVDQQPPIQDLQARLVLGDEDGAVHRLENPGKIQLELIEVQTGSYFGEDDIIRIEDDYRRT